MKANTVYYAKLDVTADVNGTPFNLNGGCYVLGAFGTFGSGTAKVQWTKDADATWTDIGPQNGVATQLTAAGTTAFFLPPGRYRVIFGGSTNPSAQVWFGDAQTGT